MIPLVSIIIPTYDRRADVGQAVDTMCPFTVERFAAETLRAYGVAPCA